MSTDSAHHDSHDSHVAHHFRDAGHQYESSKQGIWLFMVTEILMFGGLFVGYFIFHNLYPEMFREGSKQLSWIMGSINTCVLLFSSWTMAGLKNFYIEHLFYHEVGHHVQNLLGIADKVHQARQRAGRAEGNALSVRMELQADCFAGVWGYHAKRNRQLIEPGLCIF